MLRLLRHRDILQGTTWVTNGKSLEHVFTQNLFGQQARWIEKLFGFLDEENVLPDALLRLY